MKLSNLHTITNFYQDMRLLSLKEWKSAAEIEPRDQAGPYVVTQEGYAPDGLSSRPDEFVLSRCGKWLCTAQFFNLPAEQRRAGFVFGTMAEVIQLLQELPSRAALWQPAEEPDPEAASMDEDELKQAYCSASKQPLDSMSGSAK